ncbi:Proton-dependent oligopeptide transporter family [Corchorus olitorius]|uniref:Proton-dependent oligopeptide transporter family n=1 Tax=Corchorus olitorius TaxID=93759 RepID=A0A1R3H5I6_9ROSI|nr:Proton-dependent oligopeptide transporter family [Corchorus olitorius]
MQGLLLLWLKWKVRLSHNSSIGLFYPALLSLAIGIAGVEAAKEFLLLQFPDKELEEEVVAAVEAAAAAGDQFSQKKKLEEFERTIETRASVWWYAFISVGSIVASTFTSGLSWETTLMVCFILMAVVYSFFCSGNRYYNKKPSTTSFTFLASKFKFRLLPLWTIFLVYSLFQAAGETFFIEQSDRLDDRVDIRIPIYSFNINRIPLSSFYILQNFTSFAISLLSDYLIENRWSTSATTQRLATCVRICFGMVLACGCCMMAWWVEIRRLKLIHDEAESGETQEEFLPMKILWLAPQFFLLGIVNGLVGEVQRHFFYERVPLRFMVFESPFNQALMCIGRFLAALSVLVARNWIHDSIEESRVDKYLLMLAILIFFILIIYIFLSCILDWNIKEEAQSCDQSLALPQELER